MPITRRFVTTRYVSYSDENEVLTTRVSLAVRPVDAFLRIDPHGLVPGPEELEKRTLVSEIPLTPLKVAIKGRPRILPVRKEDGFYCFTDLNTLADGVYTLRVAPDADSSWYLPSERSLLVQAGRVIRVIEDGVEHVIDPAHPAYDLELQPTTSYPFPGTATLIRGFGYTKEDSSRKPVAGARVSTAVRQLVFDPQAKEYRISQPEILETSTNKNGEFVLFFKRFVENKDAGIKGRRSGILKRVEQGGDEVDQEILITVEKDGQQLERTLQIKLKTKTRPEEAADEETGEEEGGDLEEDNQQEALREGAALKLEFEFPP